jgi:hypothetical protein
MKRATALQAGGEHAAGRPSRMAERGRARGAPIWLVPLVVLIGISLALSLAVFTLSGGKEIADDVVRLAGFAREPFVLWGNYKAAGLSDRWGSFPPLLPLVFGSLVYPWLRVAGDFWGFRLGILSWSVVALFALYLVLKREREVSLERTRAVLLIFVLLPSVLGAIAFIPQEEVYVSLFCIGLYYAAKTGRRGLLFFLLVLAVLAGKYFLLVLAVPLAFDSRAPVRNLLRWGATCLALLGAYILYHRELFGLTPIASYVLDPGSSISLWGLLWNMGYMPPEGTIRILSLILVAAGVFFFSAAGRRKGIGLQFSMAGTLYITLLCLSITVPAYVLWVVPLTLLAVAVMRERRHVVWTVVGLFLWGAGEWGANLFRGVRLALDTTRPEGKTAVAKAAERFLGAQFPYHRFHVACIALVVAAGLLLLCVLWIAGKTACSLERARASR